MLEPSSSEVTVPLIVHSPSAHVARMARISQAIEALQGPVAATGGLLRALGGVVMAAAFLAITVLSLSAIVRGEAKLKVTSPDGAYALEIPGVAPAARAAAAQPSAGSKTS